MEMGRRGGCIHILFQQRIDGDFGSDVLISPCFLLHGAQHAIWISEIGVLVRFTSLL